MDCSPPGSSVHGISQARILEWVAISFSRGCSWPSDRTRVSSIAGRHFTIWATRESHKTIYYVQKCTSTDTAFPFPEFTQTDILTQACRDGCAKTFTAALFALAKGYNHHKYLPALELLNMSLQSNIMYLLKLTRQVYGYRIRMVSKVYIFEKKSYRRVLMTQDAIYLSISIHV